MAFAMAQRLKGEGRTKRPETASTYSLDAEDRNLAGWPGKRSGKGKKYLFSECNSSFLAKWEGGRGGESKTPV